MARRITYTYDAADQLLTATDPDATLTFGYDSGGNLLTARTSGGGSGQPNVTLTYSYNQLNERLSMTDSLGTVGRTTLAYDAAHRITTITRSLGGTEKTWLKFGYDNADRRTSIERTIGGSGTKILTTLAYDNASRLTTIQHAVSGGSALATYVYGFNSGGLITTETNAEGLATYSYDDTNQLTGVDRPVGQTDETYGYDLNGNRNTSGYTVGSGNTLTASPGYTYTYDAEGNTSAKTETGTGKVTTYSYDHRNRMTGVTQKNSGGTVIMQATYTYDALGRRIKTDVDADGAGGGTATVTWSMYDGHNTYADVNSGGTLTMRYLHGLAIDELYARMDSGGTSAWYLTDHLGTVRDIVDTSGLNIYHASYEAFGSIVSESGSGGDRFTFTSRETDKSTGLQQLRSRFYNDALGRWIQIDKIGFKGRDSNLYRYVGNDPANHTDPTGEVAFAIPAAYKAVVVTAGLAVAAYGALMAQLYSGVMRLQYLNVRFDTEIRFPDVIKGMRDIYDAWNKVHRIKHAIDEITNLHAEKAQAEAQKQRSPYPTAKRYRYNTKKSAYEAAKRAGDGKEPTHHPHGDHGPHYHPDVPKPPK